MSEDASPRQDFRFQYGVKVTLQYLNLRTVRSICAPYGTLQDVLSITSETVKNTTPDELRQLSLVNTRLLDYCAGWGFEELPGKKDRRALKALGFDADNEHVLRNKWFHYVLVSSAKEAGDFLGAVLTYTLAG